jgi:hypothetical protein
MVLDPGVLWGFRRGIEIFRTKANFASRTAGMFYALTVYCWVHRKLNNRRLHCHLMSFLLLNAVCVFTLVDVAILHPSTPRKDGLRITYRSAPCQDYSVANFAVMRVLDRHHSSGLRCSCYNDVRFWCDREAQFGGGYCGPCPSYFQTSNPLKCK